MVTSTRTRGVVGKLIDPEHPAMVKFFEELNKGHEDTPMRLDSPLLMLETTDGPAVVMTEGVGWWSGDKPDTINTPVRWGTMGWGEIDIPTEILVAAAENGEERDLADHIRSFGARLEGNFYEWYRAAVK